MVIGSVLVTTRPKVAFCERFRSQNVTSVGQFVRDLQHCSRVFQKNLKKGLLFSNNRGSIAEKENVKMIEARAS